MNEGSQDIQRQAVDCLQVIKNRVALICLSFLLVFATAAIITYIMPRKYRGRVEMKIERVQEKVQMFNPSQADLMVASDVFVKTEFESITKPETLYPVVDKLELQKVWSMPTRQAALAKLRGNLDAQSSIRSDFVTIEFYDQDAKLAAEVANGVAASYMEQRIEIESRQKKLSLDKLQLQITEREEERDAARLKYQGARKKAGIVGDSLVGGMLSTTPGANIQTKEESMVMNHDQMLLQIKIEEEQLRAELEQLNKLTPDQMMARAAGLQLQDQNIMAMTNEYQKQVITRSSLESSGLGRKHPQILAIDDQIETTKKIILDAVEAHKEGQQSRLEGVLKRKESLQAYTDEAKEEMLDKQSAKNAVKEAQDEVTFIESMLYKLKETHSQTKAELESVKSPATIFAKAEAEPRPTKPNVLLNLALGAVVGLMFGVGLAFFLEYMDTSVKSLDDVERFLGVPVLAVVPKNVGVLHRTSGFNPDAEAYRILRTNIEFNRRNPELNCITVTSGGAGEGKSTTLCNLATVCAQGGYSVLLIDADLRRPSLHRLFDVSNATGLTNYLTTNVRLEEVVVRTPVDNLYFLPSGLLPADSAGILNSQRMGELVADVKSRFDLVLIDAPPILGVSDASVLANEADLTIVVVQHRKLPRHMLLRVKQTVENVGGRVLGVVLNNVDVRSDSSYQYYTSYYTYYSPNNAPAAPGEAPQRRRKRKDSTHEPAAPLTSSPGNQQSDVF